jgi:hypothetical protein
MDGSITKVDFVRVGITCRRGRQVDVQADIADRAAGKNSAIEVAELAIERKPSTVLFTAISEDEPVVKRPISAADAHRESDREDRQPASSQSKDGVVHGRVSWHFREMVASPTTLIS